MTWGSQYYRYHKSSHFAIFVVPYSARQGYSSLTTVLVMYADTPFMSIYIKKIWSASKFYKYIIIKSDHKMLRKTNIHNFYETVHFCVHTFKSVFKTIKKYECLKIQNS